MASSDEKSYYTYQVRAVLGYGETRYYGITILFEDSDGTAGSINVPLHRANPWLHFIDGDKAEVTLVRKDYTENMPYGGFGASRPVNQTSWTLKELRLPRNFQFDRG